MDRPAIDATTATTIHVPAGPLSHFRTKPIHVLLRRTLCTSGADIDKKLFTLIWSRLEPEF